MWEPRPRNAAQGVPNLRREQHSVVLAFGKQLERGPKCFNVPDELGPQLAFEGVQGAHAKVVCVGGPVSLRAFDRAAEFRATDGLEQERIEVIRAPKLGRATESTGIPRCFSLQTMGALISSSRASSRCVMAFRPLTIVITPR